MQNDMTTTRRGSMLLRLGAFAIIGTALVGAGCDGVDEPTNPIGPAITTGDMTTIVDPLISTTHYDDINNQTVCNGMHCCGDGFGVRGIHISLNVLRCTRVWDPTKPGQGGQDINRCTVENTGLFRDTTRACPTGRYIKGVDVPGNRLTCCPYPTTNSPTTLFLDGNGSQVFLPETNSFDPTEAPHYENDTDGHRFLHACPPPWPSSPAVMEGLNGGADDLLCAR